MPLSTGASLITLSLLLNKMSGLYGIVALLTGYELSSFQLSMYIYSIFALVLTVLLTPHIKTQSPFHCLALAWFYVLDSIINAAYTAAFAVTWFLVLAQHKTSNGQSAKVDAPGAGTIDDTAGFTSPEKNVSKVEVVASPHPHPLGGQEAVVGATPAAGPATTGVLDGQSMNSIGVMVLLWTIRAYFCLVMLSWARGVIRHHIAVVSVRSGEYSGAGKMAPDPFSTSRPEGEGWKGKLGRFMIGLGRTYFLGADEDESWTEGMSGKFGRQGVEAGATGNANGTGIVLQKIETRPVERERRRRSGTGPPLPEVQAAAITNKEAEAEAGDGLLKVPSQ